MAIEKDFYIVEYTAKNKNACGGKITFKYFSENWQQCFDTEEEAKKSIEKSIENNKIGEVLSYSIYKCHAIYKKTI